MSLMKLAGHDHAFCICLTSCFYFHNLYILTYITKIVLSEPPYLIVEAYLHKLVFFCQMEEKPYIF